MTFPLDNFKEHAIAAGRSDEFIRETVEYVEKLQNSDLPVLFSIVHLALSSRFSIRGILNICNSDRIDYYKRYKLRKKRGGYRVIQSPESELKYLQKWILLNVLEKIPSHTNCKGFDKGTSIKQNAQEHLNSECILKIDLLRFYDSINEKRVYGIFRSLGYQKNLAVSMAKICTIKPSRTMLYSFKKNEQRLKQEILEGEQGLLPQGACTSPKLSNLILRRLDHRLAKLCEKNELKYTRYADDLTFSGQEEKLRSAKKVIYKIIRDEKFHVNYGKTQFLKRGSRFFVTGLSVHNDEVRVPKRFKKEIEHHLYHCNTNGVVAHIRKNNITNRNFKDWLLGCICFVNSVEPDQGAKYFEEYNKINWPI